MGNSGVAFTGAMGVENKTRAELARVRLRRHSLASYDYSSFILLLPCIFTSRSVRYAHVILLGYCLRRCEGISEQGGYFGERGGLEDEVKAFTPMVGYTLSTRWFAP